jgi:hypothetical protein
MACSKSEKSNGYRTKYVIEYHPAEAYADRKWHQVRVKSDVPRVKIYARKRYYAH